MLSSLHRYIGKGEEYRAVAEIVEEVDALETEEAENNKTLRKILRTFTAGSE